MAKKNPTTVADLRPDPRNPRKITPEKLEMLRDALNEFGDLSGIVYNRATQQIVGGHQRQKIIPPDAIIYITQYYDTPTEVGTVGLGHVEMPNGERFSYREVDWPEAKQTAANIAANKGAGAWDYGILADLLNELDAINFELPKTMFDMSEIENIMAGVRQKKSEASGAPQAAGGGGASGMDANSPALKRAFVVPPLSVIDTRQGYFKERVERWHEEIGEPLKTEVTPPPALSNPVVAECILKWFGMPSGTVLDLFAGDEAYGFVAKKTGHHYIGLDIRGDQCAHNQAKCDQIEPENTPQCGSAVYAAIHAENVDERIGDGQVDLVIARPPLFGLQKFSNLPGDLSNYPEYPAYLDSLAEILKLGAAKLKPGRFLALLANDIRGPDGVFEGLIPAMIDWLGRSCGMAYYNDVIVIHGVAGASLRVAHAMPSRRIVRSHENLVVFFKGEPASIRALYPEIAVPGLEIAGGGMGISETDIAAQMLEFEGLDA